MKCTSLRLVRIDAATAMALLLAAGCGRPALADDAARAAILDRLQAQFSICVAFYMIERSCVEDSNSRSRLAAVSRRPDALAGAISMSAADAALRLDLNLSAERGLIQDHCGGVATLAHRYAVECDPLSSAPD